jgi:hypothetical protein
LAAPELDRGADLGLQCAAAQRSVRQGPSIDKKLRATAAGKVQS